MAGRLCRRWMRQHDAGALLQLLAPLPRDVCLVHANLALPLLWALITELQLDAAAALLESIEPALLQQDAAHPFPEPDNTLEACAVLLRLAGEESLATGQRLTLLTRLTEKPGPLQAELLNRYAALLYGSGHIPLAKAVARRCLQVALQQDDVIQLQLARTQMLLCDVAQGHLDALVAEAEQDAAALSQRRLADTTAPDPALEVATAINDCTRAYLYYECGRVEMAEPLLVPALKRIAPCHFSLPLTLGAVTRARILLRSGQQRAAERMLEQLDELVDIQRNHRLRAFVCFEKMRQRLASGTQADDLIARYELNAQPVHVETLFREQFQEEHLFWLKSRIMALLMSGDHATASEYALKGVIKSLNIGSYRHLASFYLFKALSEFHLGRYQDAKATGNRALELCWQHGYRQLLVDNARALQDLWRQMQRLGDLSTLPDVEFLRELLPGPEPVRVVQPAVPAGGNRSDLRRDLGLTEKEVEILALLAEGLCNKKIGSRASIALTTVKWHLQNVFSKLDVRNRTEAVLKAQDLGLLSGSAGR
ncbi:MAG TPA: LuxR C-terminal-related transcriptional regulator [Dongiaceae bacterium]|nr:LuxR C-terminal-related transcriptional regulator [Dongiaceae bacterium]